MEAVKLSLWGDCGASSSVRGLIVQALLRLRSSWPVPSQALLSRN